MYCITMGFTSQNEQFAARCEHRVSRGRATVRRTRVSGKWIKMHSDLSYYCGKVSACMCNLQVLQGVGGKNERKKGRKKGGQKERQESWPAVCSSTILNEAYHCAWPGGSLLVLLFALLICMLMYLFYGSTVLIHFKINYPSGTPIPRPGSNVY